MKCNHCGQEIASDSIFCEYCGTKVSNDISTEKRASGWLKFGSFMIPLLGFVMFGIKKKEEPLVAKSCLKWGVVGLVFGIVLNVIVVLIETNAKHTYSYNYNEEPFIEENVLAQSEECIYSQPEEFYCDGIYPYDRGHTRDEKGHWLTIVVPDLNRDHFRIQFAFKPVSYRGKLSWTDAQYPLVLGESSRAMGICLKSDRHIYITTQNHANMYSTGVPYSTDEYTYVDLEYNEGNVIVSFNGNSFTMEEKICLMDNENVFNSVCYSTSNAFKGYIKEVYVYNLD